MPKIMPIIQSMFTSQQQLLKLIAEEKRNLLIVVGPKETADEIGRLLKALADRIDGISPKKSNWGIVIKSVEVETPFAKPLLAEPQLPKEEPPPPTPTPPLFCFGGNLHYGQPT